MELVKGISADEITRRVTGKVQSGSIVLFHNAGEHTPEALPDILDFLLAEGYDIVPVVHQLAAARGDGLGLLGILPRPVAHEEEGRRHAVVAQHVEYLLRIVRAPRRVSDAAAKKEDPA